MSLIKTGPCRVMAELERAAAEAVARQLTERDERIRVLVSALELFIEHERGHRGDDGHDVAHPCGVMERARAALAEPAE